MLKRAAALVLLLPALAPAAGLDIPDLTAAGLARAGANAASPGDASAFYYNPGALGYLEGFSFVLDGRMINHQVTFRRLEGGSDVGFEPVSNTGGASVAPFVALAYNFKKVGLAGLTLALGLHPALGNKSYAYVDPSKYCVLQCKTGDTRTEVDEVEYDLKTPNRYVAVFNDNTILYPSLSIAYRVADWGSFGVSLQSAYAELNTKTGLYGGPAFADADKTIALEPDPTLFDALVTLKTSAPSTPTLIAGGAFRFLEGKLRAGATVRLPHTLRTSGTLATKLLNEDTESRFKVKVTGDQVKLDLPYPLVARAAAGWFEEAWDAELDLVLEGWQAMDKIVVTPVGITMSFQPPGQAETSTELKPINLEKGWSNSISGRVGGELRLYKLLPALEMLRPRLRAGGLYENSPIPPERLALDFVSLSRATVNVGLGLGFGPVDLWIGYAHSIEGVAQIRNSAVKFGTTDPDVEATVVANGDYTSQLDILAASVGGSFDL